MAMQVAIAVLGIVLLWFVYEIWQSLRRYEDINMKAIENGVYNSPDGRLLMPNSIALRHAVGFIPQKVNYYASSLRGIYHVNVRQRLWGKECTEADVIRYMMEVPSLLVYIVVKEEGNGKVATLALDDFQFPTIEHRRDNTIRMHVYIPPDIPTGEGVNPYEHMQLRRFDFNGMTGFSHIEQMNILVQIFAGVIHPMIHTFNNAVYRERDNDVGNEYPEIFYHGPYLNELAHHYPGWMFGLGPDHFEAALHYNGHLPLRDHAASLRHLMPYSETVQFMFKARRIMMDLMKKYDVPVKPENFFIVSVIHSLDHYLGGKWCEWFQLRGEILPNDSWFNFLAATFYRPPMDVFNYRLKAFRKRNPFYKELYEQLHKVNPEMADQVTLSICF